MKTAPIRKTYNGRVVLDLPALELEKGQITAVLGSNGSGKSTLAKILTGIETPDGGTVWSDGGKVGYMPQRSMAFRMSVEKNILLGGSSLEEAGRFMEKLNLTGLAHSNAKRLSGGETAKMALARILMGNYDLLILDEPTDSMDMESSRISEELIREYREKTNCAILLITHSIKQAKRLADRVIYLYHGNLIESGPVGSVLDSPEKEETRRFLEYYGM